jgi:hypothetical protein
LSFINGIDALNYEEKGMLLYFPKLLFYVLFKFIASLLYQRAKLFINFSGFRHEAQYPQQSGNTLSQVSVQSCELSLLWQ